MEYDAAWCPVCDRQIIPKRLHLPVPPPSAPVRSKQAPSRRSPKFRTVIDQGPIPLYCSDECRLADLHYLNPNPALPHDPRRLSSPLPAKIFAPSETESDSALSSIESVSSSSSSSSASDPAHFSPSMATLAAIYNFPPPPPRPPVFEESSSSDSEHYHDYSSGIMMAGRFIDSVCPRPGKRAQYPFSQPPEPRKPVPGWSDGSNAWRASVYSFAPSRKVRDPASTDEAARAYRSFAASPHRSSHGIYSTLGDSAASTPRNVSSAASLPTAAHDLIQKYSQSFNRRSESRPSTHLGSIPTSPTSTHSFPASKPTSQRRERPIVQRGAEGKLLVPDVKLKVHSGSSTSLSSAWSSSAFGSRKSVHSPLSMASSDSSDDDTGLGASHSPMASAKRPSVETRSWSYDNIKTYPIMQLPLKKEKQIRKQIVDGREVEVEVEVVVEPTLKRLFLFSPS